MRIIFCRVSWMNRYEGDENDIFIGLGSHPKETGEGGEVYNYYLNNDKMYRGFVHTGEYKGNSQQIRLENIDPGAINYQELDDVLVIWVSRDPDDDKYKIIGWYENATIYRDYQYDEYGRMYNIEADYINCVLFDDGDGINLRTFEVPYSKKNPERFGMGHSFIWYGKGRKDDVESLVAAEEYIDSVFAFVNANKPTDYERYIGAK